MARMLGGGWVPPETPICISSLGKPKNMEARALWQRKVLGRSYAETLLSFGKGREKGGGNRPGQVRPWGPGSRRSWSYLSGEKACFARKSLKGEGWDCV